MKAIFKSKLFVLISAFIMAICCVLGANALTAPQTANAETATQSTPTLTIESNNVSYADSVYILYAVSNDGFDRNQNEIKMLFWEDVQEAYVVGTEKYAVTSSGTAKVKGKSCLIFYSDGLAAKEMTEDIYARAYVEIDGVAYYSETMKFSVLEYVYTQKEKGGLTTTQINLYTNLLNYGASAQYQFNYNIDRIANGDYFSITIINGKLPDGFAHGRYKNKDKIKIKADKAPKGMKFSHWEDENGIIISYDEHIEIELKGNKTYEAVYKDISSVATQLVLTAEVPYDGDTNDIELPTAVSIDVGGETVTLEVTWNTDSFITEKVGEQILYATLVDQTAYDKYDIEVGGIMMRVNTLPYTFAIDQTTGEYILTGYYGADTAITLPTSYRNTFVTTIASKAFNQALTLTNVVIPNTYKKIEQSAFYLCDNIADITVPFTGETASSSNSWFGYIFGATSYSKQYINLPLALCTINLAEGATRVPSYAFYNCESIEYFNLPSTITIISRNAFYGCSKLTEFTIPDNLTSLGDSVFSRSGLTRVNASSIDRVFAVGGSPFGSGADLYIKDKLITEVSIPIGLTMINSALSYCTSVTRISIPNSVTTIGDSAFSGCSSLTSITIPDSVTTIGGGAFNGCSSLASITIPDSVTSIGDSVFWDCTSLTSVVIGDNVTSIGSYMFYRCKSLTNVVIGDGVTSIDNNAFCGCSSLTSITIPDSVTSIGGSAFWDCFSLTSITIPDSVTSIGSYMFYRCRSLTNVVIGDGVTSIGDNAFLQCESLPEITIPSYVYEIGYDTFKDCSSLAKVTILSKRLTNIGSNAFKNCFILLEIYNLSDLEFTIGSDDFGGIAKYAKVIHTSLEETAYTSVDEDGFITYTDEEEIILYGYIGNSGNILIPEGVTGIYEKVCSYSHNKTITNVVIPDSVTSIGSMAFSGLENLTNVVIGNSVTSIGDYAFSGCSNLTSITCPASAISSIPKQNLQTVVITSGEIPQCAFSYCGSLTSVIISNGVTSIGTEAFSRCSSLTSITIPDSVTSIGSSAFEDCDSLTSITIPDSVTSISRRAFCDCDGLTSVVIPDNVTSIGADAFRACDGLTSVTISNSVASIGDGTFAYCTSLTSITYNGTMAEWNAIEKAFQWEYNVSATEVICRDGSVSI